MPSYYLCFMIGFYVWHYQTHYRIKWIPFNRTCSKYHHKHHWIDYPPNAFYGKSSMRADNLVSSLPLKSSVQHEALIYLMLVVILSVSYMLDVSKGNLFGAIIMATVIGVVGNYLHMSFHVHNHNLSKYHWWRKLQFLHYLHHIKGAQQNYTIANFMLNIFFGTYMGHD